MKTQNNILNQQAVLKNKNNGKGNNIPVSYPIKYNGITKDCVCFTANSENKKKGGFFKSALNGLAGALGLTTGSDAKKNGKKDENTKIVGGHVLKLKPKATPGVDSTNSFSQNANTENDTQAPVYSDKKGMEKLEAMAKNGDIEAECLNNIKSAKNKDNEIYIEQLAELCEAGKVKSNQIPKLLKTLNKNNITFLEPMADLVAEGKLKRGDFSDAMTVVNEDNAEFVERIALNSKKVRKNDYVKLTLAAINKDNKIHFDKIANLAQKENSHPLYIGPYMFEVLNKDNGIYLDKLINLAENGKTPDIEGTLEVVNKKNEKYFDKLVNMAQEGKISKISDILSVVNEDNEKYLDKYAGKIDDEYIAAMLPVINEDNEELLCKTAKVAQVLPESSNYYDNKKPDGYQFSKILKVINKDNEMFFDKLAGKEKPSDIHDILAVTNKENGPYLDKLVGKVDSENIPRILAATNKENGIYLDKLAGIITQCDIEGVLKATTKDNGVYLDKIISITPKDEYNEPGKVDAFGIPDLLKAINKDNEKYLDDLLKNLKLQNKLADAQDIKFVLTVISTFAPLENKNNINQLTLQEKRILLKGLVKANSSFFGLGLNKTLPLLPNNKEEYCSLLPKLVKSIGIDTKPLTSDELSSFNRSLESLPEILNDTNLDEIGTVKLKTSREDFVKDAKDVMKDLADTEQLKVMDYFGFEIKDDKLTGYPANLNNGEKLAEIDKKVTKAAIEQLRPVVENYSEKNEILIPNNQQLAKELNNITKGLPEVLSIIGKTQHVTHDYNLDVHTLKVLQGVINNPKYQELDDNDKKLLNLAVLLHDIRKSEGVIDKTHPKESAFDAFYITNKLGLEEADKQKLYTLIATHDWLEQVSKSEDKVKTAQDYAFELREGNSFELAKILCEADLKGVQKNDGFYKQYENSFAEMSALVDENLTKIRNTAISLPQTRIPKASELKDVPTVSANGITNKVIKMSNAQALGVKKDEFYALVHAIDGSDIDYEDKLGINGKIAIFDSFSSVDSDALLSTSFIDAKNYKVFRQQGFILDVDTENIHAGYFNDFGTGYKKDIDGLKDCYLFDNYKKEYRNYISQKLKQRLNCYDESYRARIKKISHCKGINEVEKADEKFADAFRVTFAEMDRGKRSFGREYNEILVSRPKIQGVFAYDKDYNDIPLYLRQYAADNDLPIILFGK